jgi:AraC-like DNA-binding protein
MSAGVDLALALVEQDFGRDIARATAKLLVVYHRRAGGQSQHSTLLDLDATSDRVQSALTFAKENLSKRLSVEDLATATFLSPRQFTRLFTEETGQSPAKAIERLRVESAKLMMEEGRFSAGEIARKNGFGNRDRANPWLSSRRFRWRRPRRPSAAEARVGSRVGPALWQAWQGRWRSAAFFLKPPRHTRQFTISWPCDRSPEIAMSSSPSLRFSGAITPSSEVCSKILIFLMSRPPGQPFRYAAPEEMRRAT